MFGRSTAAPAFNVQDTPRPPAEAKLEALYREQQQQHARERPPAPSQRPRRAAHLVGTGCIQRLHSKPRWVADAM